MASAEDDAAVAYQLTIGHSGDVVQITAQDDLDAIARAWTYVLDHPTVTTATLNKNGRTVSYLSR